MQGETDIATLGGSKGSWEGVPQLCFLPRMWGNVLYLNCSLVEQCSSKRVWKTVKQMCTEKSQLCNVFPWPERPQCVILGLGWVTQCGWAQTLSALLLGQPRALRGICSQAQTWWVTRAQAGWVPSCSSSSLTLFWIWTVEEFSPQQERY